MATARYHKMKIGEHELNAETLMLGYGYDPGLSEGSVKPPVFLTSTFVFRSRFFRLFGWTPRASGRRPNRPRLFSLQSAR
jgi:cystathionine beta-lyase/cystathionine gamma-synthase